MDLAALDGTSRRDFLALAGAAAMGSARAQGAPAKPGLPQIGILPATYNTGMLKQRLDEAKATGSRVCR